MNGSVERFVCGLTLAALCCAPALAAGPVHGEFGTVWWSNDVDKEIGAGSSTSDGSAPGFRAELWLIERYGVKASQYTSDTDLAGSNDAAYTSVDVLWRPFALTKNNYMAVGVGWQQADLGDVGVGNGETSGPRVSFEGGVGIIDAVFGYGNASWAPELQDSTDTSGGQLNDLSAYEVEMGVGWKLLPWITFKGGYRVSTVDFTQSVATPASATSGFTTTTGGGGFIGLDEGPEQPDPNQTAVLSSSGGSVESSGFFVGMGLRF
jgi:hypothetical protein